MGQNLNDSDTVYYVLMKDNQPVSKRYDNKFIAELALDNLPLELKESAVVTPVNASGQQVLLG